MRPHLSATNPLRPNTLDLTPYCSIFVSALAGFSVT
jgi:hypothetical protein